MAKPKYEAADWCGAGNLKLDFQSPSSNSDSNFLVGIFFPTNDLNELPGPTGCCAQRAPGTNGLPDSTGSEPTRIPELSGDNTLQSPTGSGFNKLPGPTGCGAQRSTGALAVNLIGIGIGMRIKNVSGIDIGIALAWRISMA